MINIHKKETCHWISTSDVNLKKAYYSCFQKHKHLVSCQFFLQYCMKETPFLYLFPLCFLGENLCSTDLLHKDTKWTDDLEG